MLWQLLLDPVVSMLEACKYLIAFLCNVRTCKITSNELEPRYIYGLSLIVDFCLWLINGKWILVFSIIVIIYF